MRVEAFRDMKDGRIGKTEVKLLIERKEQESFERECNHADFVS